MKSRIMKQVPQWINMKALASLWETRYVTTFRVSETLVSTWNVQKASSQDITFKEKDVYYTVKLSTKYQNLSVEDTLSQNTSRM